MVFFEDYIVTIFNRGRFFIVLSLMQHATAHRRSLEPRKTFASLGREQKRKLLKVLAENTSRIHDER